MFRNMEVSVYGEDTGQVIQDGPRFYINGWVSHFNPGVSIGGLKVVRNIPSCIRTNKTATYCKIYIKYR